MHEFLVFHTCHLQGSARDIFNNSPYKSDSRLEQWLGQGYYFWTDSDYFAKCWGEKADKYPKGYAITSYILKISDELILDLVGNTRHQLKFKDQIIEYAYRMGIELKDEQKALNIPISKVLDHLRGEAQRDSKLFKYSVIKVADKPKMSINSPFLEGHNEKLIIPTRQQIYIDDLSFITYKELFSLRRRERNGKYANVQMQEKLVLDTRY